MLAVLFLRLLITFSSMIITSLDWKAGEHALFFLNMCDSFPWDHSGCCEKEGILALSNSKFDNGTEVRMFQKEGNEKERVAK